MPKETRTYKERAKYLIQAVSKRRKRLKELAVELKGGKCAVCGYNKYKGALDFHHLENKSFDMSSQGLTRSWERIKTELEKCILVCANCHREIHGGITQLPCENEVEKSGELRETYADSLNQYGNPQPSFIVRCA